MDVLHAHTYASSYEIADRLYIPHFLDCKHHDSSANNKLVGNVGRNDLCQRLLLRGTYFGRRVGSSIRLPGIEDDKHKEACPNNR